MRLSFALAELLGYDSEIIGCKAMGTNTPRQGPSWNGNSGAVNHSGPAGPSFQVVKSTLDTADVALVSYAAAPRCPLVQVYAGGSPRSRLVL